MRYELEPCDLTQKDAGRFFFMVRNRYQVIITHVITAKRTLPNSHILSARNTIGFCELG